MKRNAILLMGILLALGRPAAAQDTLFFAGLDRAVGELTGFLRAAMEGRDGSVSVTEPRLDGERVMLGELLAMRITTRLAGEEANRSVLSPDYAYRAELLLTGKLFPAGDSVLFAWQVIVRESGDILRGGEYRLPTAGLPRAFLAMGQPAAGSAGGAETAGEGTGGAPEDGAPRTGEPGVGGGAGEPGAPVPGEPVVDEAEPNDERYLATPLSLGAGPRRFLLQPEGDVDWFRIDAAPEPGGAALLRAATGGSVDTQMTLYDERGNEIAGDDDSGDGGNALIERLIRESGVFYLRVSHYAGTPGGLYELAAELEPVELDGYEPDDSVLRASEIEVDGRPQEHSFVPGDEEDWVVFRTDRTERIIIETAGSLDTYLELYDRFEYPIDRNDDGGAGMNARIERELRPGTWFVRITRALGEGRRDGTYQVRVYR